MNYTSQALANKPITIEQNDPPLIRQLSLLPTHEERCQKAEELAEMGARMVDQFSPVNSASLVIDSFTQHQQWTQNQTEELMDDFQEELKRTREYMLEIENRTAKHLDAMNQTLAAATQAVTHSFSQFAKEQQAHAIAVMQNLEDTTGDMQAAIEHAQAQAQAWQQVAEAQEGSSSKKGQKFETKVGLRLRNFANGRGDTVESVGATPAPGSTSKKGDLVYHLKSGDRQIPIVIECKDKAMTQSGSNPFFLRDLETAMQDRGCEYGLVVGSLDENSDEHGPRFQVFQPIDDKRFVLLVDENAPQYVALEAALHLISRTQRKTEEPKKVAPVDLRAMASTVEKMTAKSRKLSGMKGDCTRIIKTVSLLRKNIGMLQDEISRDLRGMELLLNQAA